MPNQLHDSNSKSKLFQDGESKLIHLPSTNPKPFLLLSAISSQTKPKQLQDAISKFNRLQDANSKPNRLQDAKTKPNQFQVTNP